MDLNNKRRLLKLIEILRKYSDMDHKLSRSRIEDLLRESDIQVNNRKTLYSDFAALTEYGFEIEYDHSDGYYLIESPFTVSEIKIIIDALNSLKNLDDKFLNNLKDKLYNFISIYEEDLLRKLEYRSKHSDKKFINRLEDVLNAISLNKTMKIKRIDKDEEEICPLFLYRNNDFYYLYYHYIGNEKIYHTRFDNIVSMKLANDNEDNYIPRNKIIDTINESTNSFYSKKAKLIKFTIINDSEYLRTRLSDDFQNIIFTKEGFVIKASVNNAFFAKLTSYDDNIKISDKDIANEYIEFLEKIIIRNKAKA